MQKNEKYDFPICIYIYLDIGPMWLVLSSEKRNILVITTRVGEDRDRYILQCLTRDIP